MVPRRSSFSDGISRRKLLTGGVLVGTTALAGCSSPLSNEQSIEVTSRDVTYEKHSDEIEESAQILLNRDSQTLAINGVIHTSSTVTKLYPQILTASGSRNKIQVRIQPTINESKDEDQFYRYLALVKFSWIPDAVEVIVQHESGNNDIRTIISRMVNAGTTDQKSA